MRLVFRVDAGFGLSVVLILLGLVAAVTASMGIFGQSAKTQTSLQHATDLAAIAASQTERGLNTGIPCGRAKEILTLYMVAMQKCSIVSSEATVTANTTFMGIVLNATATAEEITPGKK